MATLSPSSQEPSFPEPDDSQLLASTSRRVNRSIQSMAPSSAVADRYDEVLLKTHRRQTRVPSSSPAPPATGFIPSSRTAVPPGSRGPVRITPSRASQPTLVQAFYNRQQQFAPSFITSQPLNDEFADYLVSIEAAYATLPKAYRIRVERWVAKLSAPMPTACWRRNRNLHASLLLRCIVERDFREPHHQHPPDGPLIILNAEQKLRASKAVGKATNAFWGGIHDKLKRYSQKDAEDALEDYAAAECYDEGNGGGDDDDENNMYGGEHPYDEDYSSLLDSGGLPPQSADGAFPSPLPPFVAPYASVGAGGTPPPPPRAVYRVGELGTQTSRPSSRADGGSYLGGADLTQPSFATQTSGPPSRNASANDLVAMGGGSRPPSRGGNERRGSERRGSKDAGNLAVAIEGGNNGFVPIVSGNEPLPTVYSPTAIRKGSTFGEKAILQQQQQMLNFGQAGNARRGSTLVQQAPPQPPLQQVEGSGARRGSTMQQQQQQQEQKQQQLQLEINSARKRSTAGGQHLQHQIEHNARRVSTMQQQQQQSFNTSHAYDDYASRDDDSDADASSSQHNIWGASGSQSKTPQHPPGVSASMAHKMNYLNMTAEPATPLNPLSVLQMGPSSPGATTFQQRGATADVPDYLLPSFTQLQVVVAEQSNRMKIMAEQLAAQQLGHALEIQRVESMHVIEMERLRKVAAMNMERMRMVSAVIGEGGGGGVASGERGGGYPAKGVGMQKAWEASNLPLEQYLSYLDKFSQDATVLSTLGKSGGLHNLGEPSSLITGGRKEDEYDEDEDDEGNGGGGN